MNRESKKSVRSSLIHFDNVSKVYLGNSVAVEDINFTIEPSEFVSIVGHSGAGKTTLLKLLLAEVHPSSGNVLFESTIVHKLPKYERTKLRRRIGMVFQDFRLLSHKTAYENISFAMEAAGREDDEIEVDVPYVLDLVGLREKTWHFPTELSGGEKQRLAIARAIVNQPDVVVADEPTGNLDPVNTYEVMQILKKINNLGTTVLLSTHDKGVVDILENRVLTMKNGRIIRDDETGSYHL
ncbi:MAG: ATP-binding cassette domain-containing protein [Candidatus Paceibacterota bacterium]